MKKRNIKYEKPLPDKPGYCQGLQCDIEKEIQPDKIKPNEIFEGIKKDPSPPSEQSKKQVKKKVVSKETNKKKKVNDNKKKSNY